MSRIPPQKDVAAYVEQWLAARDGWDQPHELISLHWRDGKIEVGTLSVIDTSMPPDMYPAVIAKAAREEIAAESLQTLFAYLLVIEVHGVRALPDDASAAEREQFDRDRRERRFHARPDAEEIAVAWCADIYGRLWSSARRRTDPDKIESHVYRPGQPNTPGGQMIRALTVAATATSTALYGTGAPR